MNVTRNGIRVPVEKIQALLMQGWMVLHHPSTAILIYGKRRRISPRSGDVVVFRNQRKQYMDCGRVVEAVREPRMYDQTLMVVRSFKDGSFWSVRLRDVVVTNSLSYQDY